MKSNFSCEQTPAERKTKALIHMCRNPALSLGKCACFQVCLLSVTNDEPQPTAFLPCTSRVRSHTSACSLHPGWCTAAFPEHLREGVSPLSALCLCSHSNSDVQHMHPAVKGPVGKGSVSLFSESSNT